METYIVLCTWSGNAESIDLDNPPDSIEELRKMVRAVDGKLLHAWTTLGRFDVVFVVEVPSPTALRALVSAAPVEMSTESLRAFPGMGVKSDPDLGALLKKLVKA